MTARTAAGMAVVLSFTFGSTAGAVCYTYEDLYPDRWPVNSASGVRVATLPGTSPGEDVLPQFTQSAFDMRAATGSRPAHGQFRARLLMAETNVIVSEFQFGSVINPHGDNAHRLFLQSIALLLSDQSADSLHVDPAPRPLEIAGMATSPGTPEPATVAVLAIAGFMLFLPRR